MTDEPLKAAIAALARLESILLVSSQMLVEARHALLKTRKTPPAAPDPPDNRSDH